jgi:hypothetical protein
LIERRTLRPEREALPPDALARDALQLVIVAVRAAEEESERNCSDHENRDGAFSHTSD